MAKVNRVKTCITFAFLTLINIEVSKSLRYENTLTTQINNCRWVEENDYGIDLSPLENYTTGNGFITYADNNVVYFYHPCSDISLGTKAKTECSNGISLCFFKAQNSSQTQLDINSVLKSEVNGSFYKLANAGNAVFQPSGKEMHIIYKPSNISTTVILQCNSAKDAKTTLELKDPNAYNLAHHNLILNSPYSCWRDLSHKKHYMSGWGVFFLIFLTIAAAYFFGGMLVLKHIKGATGTEMIPNYDFWVSLPGRIKGFFMRLFGRGRQGPDSYESI